MARQSISLIFILILKTSLSETNEYQLKYKLIDQLSEINQNVARDDKTTCQIQMEQYRQSLENGELWAIKMLDATAKLNSGIFIGNTVNVGNYEQCISLEYGTEEAGVIRGQHCMVYSTADIYDLASLIPLEHARKLAQFERRRQSFEDMYDMQTDLRADDSLMLTFGFGICIPASCHGSELVEQLDMILSLANLTMDSTSEYKGDRFCSTKDPIPFSTGDWVAVGIYGSFAVVMVLSTIYDLILLYTVTEGQKAGNNIFLAFSVYSNAKRIFAIIPNPPANVRSDNIPCLHGIRVLSIIWVVIGHRYLVSVMFPLDNPLGMLEWTTEYHSTLILGSTISVDTFFVLSGLLVAYTFMKDRAKGVRLNIPMMYVHRFLRLTPTLAAAVLFQATLIAHVGSGAYWKQFPYDNQKRCMDYWWATLLYIQNYNNPGSTCIGQSWYLAVDMHVYILSPIILIALWRYPKPAIGATILLILANIGLVFGLTYVNKYGTAGGDVVETDDSNSVIYVPSHTRYGPMVMGMLLGYVIFRVMKVDVKINKMLVICAWICSFTVMLAVVVGDYPMIQFDHKENLIEQSFYQSFHRIAWSAAICWVIFACRVGYGGHIDWFLSHPIWQPMSRLSYCLYLIHIMVELAMSGLRKTPWHFTDFDMIYELWGDLGLATLASLLLSLAFEAPVTIIEKELFRTPKRSVKPSDAEKIKVETGRVSEDIHTKL